MVTKTCRNCKYLRKPPKKYPCNDCGPEPDNDKWEPIEDTEAMQDGK